MKPRPLAPPCVNSGQISTTIPENPTSSPTAVFHVIRSPSRRNASTPAIQKGDDATTTAARPLGTYISAHTTPPLPSTSIRNPSRSALPHSERGGNRSPRVAM